MTWDFQTQLAVEAAHHNLLDLLWAAWFPGYTGIEVIEDLSRQRVGIDVDLHTEHGVITGQEKVRTKVYPDILLEHISVDRPRPLPGWTLTCSAELVLYAWAPSRTAIILPGAALKDTFAAHLQEWQYRFGERAADNGHYRTLNVPVPLPVLRAAIDDAHGTYTCSTCDAHERKWSDTRGGGSLDTVGCSECSPNGISPWTMHALDGQLAQNYLEWLKEWRIN